MEDIYNSISYLLSVHESTYFIHNFLTVGHFMCPTSDTVNEIFSFGTNFLL